MHQEYQLWNLWFEDSANKTEITRSDWFGDHYNHWIVRNCILCFEGYVSVNENGQIRYIWLCTIISSYYSHIQVSYPHSKQLISIYFQTDLLSASSHSCFVDVINTAWHIIQRGVNEYIKAQETYPYGDPSYY